MTSNGPSIDEASRSSGPRPPGPGRWQQGAGSLAGGDPAAGPALGGAYGERAPVSTADRWVLPSASRAVLRAFDPRLTARLRAERRTYRMLSGRLRRGGSIAVIGTWPETQAAVTALLALAVARFQGPGVLAVDASGDGGLYRRLAARPGGSTDAVLVGLAIRGADATDGAPGPPPAVGRRWLRQRLAIADEVQLLADDPAGGQPRLRGAEYDAVAGALARYVTLTVTHAPPPEAAGVVEAVVRRADLVLLVGPDHEAGRAGLSDWLPWIEWARRGDDGAVVVALVSDRPATGGRRAASGRRSASERRAGGRGGPAVAGLPCVVLPADAALVGPGRLRWDELAPGTRWAALSLAAVVVEEMVDDKRR